MINGLVDGNPFARHPLLIARDGSGGPQRRPTRAAGRDRADLVIVDEAHRMSANWWVWELDTTRRYELGQRLGTIARHLLLMTATPHSGSESNFQAFMALLDPDRFEVRVPLRCALDRHLGPDASNGQGRAAQPSTASRCSRSGSPKPCPTDSRTPSRTLYDEVAWIRPREMNRAERLGSDNPRARTVGFALTVLQRRLASSTHAILRSLQRRSQRLETKRREMLEPRYSRAEDDLAVMTSWDNLDDPDELDAEEQSDSKSLWSTLATAAQTVAELDIEIAQPADLVTLARTVRDSGEDRKWASCARCYSTTRCWPRPTEHRAS